MNDAGWKERIQDYLDDRMDADQRAAFEAEVARHPGRAAEVEQERELGTLLREEPIDVPPGLALRARQRFEASRRPKRPSIATWAWPAAALAGATLLLLSFGVFFRTAPEGELEAPEPTSIAQVRAPKRETAAAAPAEAQSKLEESAVEALALEKKKKAGKGDEPTDREDFAPVPPAPVALPTADADLRADAGAIDDELEDLGFADAGVEAELDAVAKSRPPARAQPEPELAETGRRRDKSTRMELSAALDPATPTARGEGLAPGGVRLSRRIDPGRRLIDDPTELARWLEAEPVLRQLGFDPTRQRLVLVGGLAAGFSCADLRLAVGEDGYRLVEPVSDSPLQRADGETACALAVPGDGRPVRVDGDPAP